MRHQGGAGFRGAELFRRASERVVAELSRRTPDMTWSVSRVESGHQVHLHVSGDLISVGDTVDWDSTLCRRMTEGAAHVVHDTLADSSYSDLRVVERVRGYAGMPIRGDDGTLFGVLCGLRADPMPSESSIDDGLLSLMTGLLSDVLEGARRLDLSHRAERSALVLAQTDHLTGLVNRRGWELALEQGRESLESYGDHMTVVIVDLDGFKRVNDNAGHEVGDAVLRQIGRVLSGLVRRGDVVARLGGDEFGMLLADCPETDAGSRTMEIRRGLDRARVAASSGHATATTPSEFDTFIISADQEMYRMKSARRSPPEGSDYGIVVAT